VVPIGGGAGSVGQGGDVTITNTATGTITMTGAGSVGLFAQSVGGGGGIATADGAATFALHAQGNGNGGIVSVVNHGSIIMTGNNAAGVFVQSVGGGGGVVGKSGDLLGLDPMFQGTAGGIGQGAAVSLTQDQDVAAIGLNSVALLAQSAGGTGNGNIDVTVTAGTTITGGSGIGAGVGFLDGATNLLTNNGRITSINQIAGYAMTATGGNDTIDNYGTMIGSINLGAGVNAFNNRAAGLFDMGANVMLGAGNFLTNNGTMSPGGINNVFTSAVTGNLLQSAGGTYLLDLDFGPSTADRINATGTGSLAGKVTVNLLNKAQVLPGDHQMTIVSAAGGLTNPGLTLDVASSAILTYKLLNPNSNDLVLDYNVSFNPVGLPPQFASIGNAINAIQSARICAACSCIVRSARSGVADKVLQCRWRRRHGGDATGQLQRGCRLRVHDVRPDELMGFRCAEQQRGRVRRQRASLCRGISRRCDCKQRVPGYPQCPIEFLGSLACLGCSVRLQADHRQQRRVRSPGLVRFERRRRIGR
ncbi:MAG: hypothetical protein ABJA75_27240, partial [Bradyrhizobium sp.]